MHQSCPSILNGEPRFSLTLCTTRCFPARQACFALDARVWCPYAGSQDLCCGLERSFLCMDATIGRI